MFQVHIIVMQSMCGSQCRHVKSAANADSIAFSSILLEEWAFKSSAPDMCRYKHYSDGHEKTRFRVGFWIKMLDEIV